MTLTLQQKLLKRKALGNLRELKLPRPLIDFASSDYLGLARSPLFATAILQEICPNGFGSTGSRLLTGNSLYAENLERRLALFHGYESATLFGCGYMANVGLLSTVAHSQSAVFFDASIHASTHDGIRLSQAAAFPFRHNDLNQLEERLKRCTLKERFLCVESVYSTDGSLAPLPQICSLAKRYDVHLIVDEAHAVGVCGPQGKGCTAEYSLTPHVFAQVTTFGKAPGVYGAVVLGSSLLKQALINFSTPYVYTTAPPLHMLAAIHRSYDLFPHMDKERDHLRSLTQKLRKFSGSNTPIHALPIPGNENVKQTAQKIAKSGFDVRALLSPTVRRGREVLRLCLHAFNTQKELDRLMDILS